MELAVLCGALSACAGGLALMFGAGNLLKRLAGLVAAHAGAALALIALGGRALEPIALALVAASAAMAMIGTAAAVRIAETYGGVEMEALDPDDRAEDGEGA